MWQTRTPLHSRDLYIVGEIVRPKRIKALDWHLTQNTHFWKYESIRRGNMAWEDAQCRRQGLKPLKIQLVLIVVVTVVLTIPTRYNLP